MNNNNKNTILSLSLLAIIMLSISNIFYFDEVIAKEKKEKEKSNKESGELINKYFKDSSVLSNMMKDESILEMIRIPKDKPLTVTNAEYMYCWYLEQGDQINGIKALNLWGRMQAEFNDDQVNKFKTLDCHKIL